ncbi:MAG: glycoside hydrolase family 127 protein, partial [Puniceicoccales bacterium]|nr:glycoside hydrolase family 127 protein [Puniceicoccales bacterium]
MTAIVAFAGSTAAGTAAAAGIVAAAEKIPGPDPARKPVAGLFGGELGVERVASAVGTPPPYLARVKTLPHWLAIDLGRSVEIEAVKLFSFAKDKIDGKPEGVSPDGFPVRFKIEAAANADFSDAIVIADFTGADFDKLPFGHMPVLTFPAQQNLRARHVRLVVTKPGKLDGKPALMLWRFEVIERGTGGRDAATGARLSDSVSGALTGKPDASAEISLKLAAGTGGLFPAHSHPLLRPRRPLGDGVVLDRPEQVTAAATWRPAAPALLTPERGVTIGGLFADAFERNRRYLLSFCTLDDYTRPFLQRAGKPAPRGTFRSHFWTEVLAGANTGRFMMGAGNTLRWREDAELRERLAATVGAIEACATPEGYIMGYPEKRVLTDQTNGYVRSWVCNGLIEAGRAGDARAFALLRRWGDWFNTSPYLPEMALRVAIGWQGMIANSRTYVDTPVGVPADIQVLQRHFQLNYWLDQLAARDPAALWAFPYDRTHSYLVVTLNAYADMFRATGDRRYLDAVLGAWEMTREHFEHTGGAITLIEDFALVARRDPPASRRLRVSNGELCGNVFHTFLSQQLRVQFPDDERFAAEMEKSLYNIVLAAQSPDGGIRYHARQLRSKEGGKKHNTCCEGQGTRIYATLPEFIYKTSAAGDGVWVDLFNESEIEFLVGVAGEKGAGSGEQGAGKVTGGEKTKVVLAQHTEFPKSPEVRLVIKRGEATFKLRVRIPSWAAAPVTLTVNGAPAATGAPGTYVTLERPWRAGDTIAFTLPMSFRLTRYAGTEKGYAGAETYALEYGPLLMSLLVPNLPKDAKHTFPFAAAALISRLRPVAGKPLHFAVEGTG